MLARRSCKIRREKHPRAFLEVVEGDYIYNFHVHCLVKFYSSFWRFLRLNCGTVNFCRAGDAAPRRAATSRARACPRHAVPASTSGPTQPHPEVRPFPRSRVPRSGALQGASKSREPRAAPRFTLRALARAARRACRCPRSGGCARPCFEAKPLHLARWSLPI
jgi:hypothetical protein